MDDSAALSLLFFIFFIGVSALDSSVKAVSFLFSDGLADETRMTSSSSSSSFSSPSCTFALGVYLFNVIDDRLTSPFNSFDLCSLDELFFLSLSSLEEIYV